ncbi:thioredoxin family protein [Spirosoma aerophilum]
MNVFYSLLIILASLPGFATAQGIVFEKGSWADAVKKARKEKKLLFLHIDSPSCGACGEVASTAFNSPLMKEKFALHFVSFRTDGTTGVGKELVDRLEQECVPASVYLDADENPLVRYCGTTSFDRIYLEKAEEAFTKSRERPLKALAEAYAKGDRSSALLRQYIDRLREQDLSNTEPLEAYVMSLPPDSLRSGRVLRFIFEQAPVVGSKADSVFRRDYVKLDSLYKAVGWNKAVELNNRITNNSVRKAIKEKNVQLASRTAFFRQRTFTNDYKNGLAARDWVLMRYFRGVKDTLTYLKLATDYYDKQFMTARVDSVQKLDELESQRRMRGEFPGPNGTVARPKPGQMISVMAFPNTQRFVSALNQAAMDFQELTRDPIYLNKALSWSKRTLEYREDGGLMDTYARVLYRLGRKEEALEWQAKAVKKEKERQSPMVASLQKTLDQMKTGTF